MLARASVYVLVFAVTLLAALGIVMLASTTFFLEGTGGETYATLRRQGSWLFLGTVATITLSIIGYQRLYQYRWWIFSLSAFGLILCYVPFFAVEVNGASRWISLKGFGLKGLQFQPSELTKLACAIIIAGWFARNEPKTREFLAGFVLPSGIILSMVLLVAGEVDLGTAALLAALGGGMMFVAGTRLVYLLPILAAGAISMVGVVKLMPNRLERVIAFTDLEKYKDGLGLQQWRALMAFGSGGFEGAGLGNGRQKMLYLPEAHTDFIFSMVGEELGLPGTLLVVGTFVMLILAGMSIAYRAPDRFGRLLAFGITFTLALEALINMGVTTALLPNKGLALPFVSNGGSGLLFAMASVGILINIHRNRVDGVANNDLPLTRRRRM